MGTHTTTITWVQNQTANFNCAITKSIQLWCFYLLCAYDFRYSLLILISYYNYFEHKLQRSSWRRSNVSQKSCVRLRHTGNLQFSVKRNFILIILHFQYLTYLLCNTQQHLVLWWAGKSNWLCSAWPNSLSAIFPPVWPPRIQPLLTAIVRGRPIGSEQTDNYF